MELQGQTALVTGGTAGIGLESARLLAREGSDVMITGRDVERGKNAVDAFEEAGSVRFVAADLSDLDSVAELIRQTGPVDIIVNNAGSFPVAPTVDQHVASFEQIFDTNVRGAYFFVAQLVPHMLERDAAASSTSPRSPRRRGSRARPSTARPRRR
jgi:NAD(P)-dependent dehydrogenase (short-subunit alcohol dehydrogenase family)